VKSTALEAAPASVGVLREGADLHVRLSGDWTLGARLPSVEPLAPEIEARPTSRVVFDADELGDWDSALVTFVYAVAGLAGMRDVPVDLGGLPRGVQKLVSLARANQPRVEAPPEDDDALTARVGKVALRAWRTLGDALHFLGEVVVALGRLLRGRSRIRRVDLLHAFEATGIGALGIVAFINFLLGAVLAFVGAVQLQQFGATHFVANLVAIAVTRELAALMTGMVMAGRTAASFAAVLGTMTVNEEMDALTTMGLRPVDFLVAPRVVATACMLPALVAYADVMGLLGGLFVGVTVLDLGTTQYLRQTEAALALRHVIIGVAKGALFGLVVSITGCYYGMRCGRSAAAVGEATTRAVVAGIVLVVVVDAAVTLFLHLARL